MGATVDLVAAGARPHQSGCLGRIGMGQSPTSNGNSLRTMPRNFPGRSCTTEDRRCPRATGCAGHRFTGMRAVWDDQVPHGGLRWLPMALGDFREFRWPRPRGH
jgi:hypothetical protein